MKHCLGVFILLLLGSLACRGGREQRARSAQPAPPQVDIVQSPDGPAGAKTAASEPVTELWINGDVIRTTDILQPVLPKIRQSLAESEQVNRQRLIWDMCSAQLVDEIRQTLLYQEARRELGDENLQLLERYVDQEIRARVNREFEGRESRLEQHLEQMGMTINELRERERRRILVSDYFGRHIHPQISYPSRKELLEYYEQHLAEYVTPGSRELFLIDIPKEDDTARARANIEHAARRLDAGEPFEDVARSLSDGIHAADGGRWGPIKSPLAGRYAAISDIFFELPADHTSQIIESDDAFFIVRVGSVVPEQTQSFEEIQPELMQRYRNRQADEIGVEMVTELYEKATISVDEQSFLITVAAAAEQALMDDHE